MGRRPRTDYAGALQHVAVQGNLQQPLFAHSHERRMMLRLLAETVQKYGWRCLSYVLMTNHVHLVLETPEANLAAGMQQLNTRFSKAMHDRRGRLGHMLRNRYFSVAVEEEEHVLELTRYLPLNPVKAGLIEQPEDYIWSSYGAELKLLPAEGGVTVGWATALHGSVEALRRFVAAGMAEPGAPGGTPGSETPVTPPRPEGRTAPRRPAWA
jgi:REP element-mobilizing transposase RayT